MRDSYSLVNTERCFDHALNRGGGMAGGLFASETACVGRRPRRQMLRFSRSGDPTIERLYRSRWVSPKLSERKRERNDDAPT